MPFPYPITDELFERVLAGTDPIHNIDDPVSFWAFYLSCVDCDKFDGGRLTEKVQSRLRRLISSQLFRGENGEITGAQPSIFLQYSGNSFCFVTLSTDEETRAEELRQLRAHGAMMPAHDEDGRQLFTLNPNDTSVTYQARDVFVLMLDRSIHQSGLDLGHCLPGGFSSLLDPDLIDETTVKLGGPHKLSSKYDNVAYNDQLETMVVLDPFKDAYAIKKAAATRQGLDKGNSILNANLQGAKLKDAKQVLVEAAPNGNLQSFKAPPAATAIPDPSRMLRDACPSAETLKKLQPFMDARVYAHWHGVLDKAQEFFVNHFVQITEKDNPYDVKRLKFPVSASFIGHLSVEQALKVLALPNPGVVAKRDSYRFSCISLPELMRPGKATYSHEFNLSMLSAMAIRFKNSADYMGFLREAASRIIQNITRGQFDNVLSASNRQKIFERPDVDVVEVIDELKKLAYFNFRGFCDEYLYETRFLETAYSLKKKNPPKVPEAEFDVLNRQFEALWQGSIKEIQAAVSLELRKHQAKAHAAVALKA